MLPLQAKLDYMRSCGEIAFSYREVEDSLSRGHVQRYISWDHIIDVFLSRQAPPPTTVLHDVMPYVPPPYQHQQ
jgi:hypothetical protein